MSDAEKVVAELRQAEGIFKEDPEAYCAGDLFGRAADLIAHQAARLEEVTRERDAFEDAAQRLPARDARIASLEAALTAAEAEKERLTRALTFLGENNSRSLTFDGKFYCEDDNSDLWVVTEARGGINDREWVLLGSGKTPAEALLSAAALSEKETGA